MGLVRRVNGKGNGGHLFAPPRAVPPPLCPCPWWPVVVSVVNKAIGKAYKVIKDIHTSI